MASNNWPLSPSPDELEVNLFGPGYGESLVIHLGYGHWMIVDSCPGQGSDQPAALSYLQGLGVDVQTAVKMVVATHWHDDHIRGIARILREAQAAKFVLSSAMLQREFLTLIGWYQNRPSMITTGLDEMAEVFRILGERIAAAAALNAPIHAVANRQLYLADFSNNNIAIQARVLSLSPSDSDILRSQLALSELMPKVGDRKKRIAAQRPNNASVVLWVEVGTIRLLLGADLENTSDPNTGWQAIVDGPVAARGQADLTKVPHHGSSNGYHPDVWATLLSPKPWAILSPYSRGRVKLPTEQDLNRIRTHTNRGYITAPHRTKRTKWSQPLVEDMIRQATREMHKVRSTWGQITLRRSIAEVDQSWHVKISGDAYPLTRN